MQARHPATQRMPSPLSIHSYSPRSCSPCCSPFLPGTSTVNADTILKTARPFKPFRELMVMTFLDGAPLTEAGKLVGNLSRAKKDMAKRLILKRWVRGSRARGRGARGLYSS